MSLAQYPVRPSIEFAAESVRVYNKEYEHCGACGNQGVLRIVDTYVCLACSSAWTKEEWDGGCRG